MNDEKKPRLLPTGWWFCLCERKCRCGGTPRRLNPPELENCLACGASKPSVVSRRRPLPG